MSQPNTDPNVQNGLPYKWDGSKPPYNQYPLNNGLGGSSQSSRDSSPIPRFSNVPQSQLPPSRGQIPSSQLPPGRISVSPIIGQQTSALKSASYLNTTPNNNSPINTSTPIMRRTEHNSVTTGNILTGNNSYVNTSLSSQSVPPNMPNDLNVRNSRIAQTNGQSNKQNLNQPLLISSMEQKHTGNLLTNQLDQHMPAFVPVNAQTVFPVPPNTKPDSKNEISPPQNEEKQNLTSHFMNPTQQSKFTPTHPHLPTVDSKSQTQTSDKPFNSTAGLFPAGSEPPKATVPGSTDNQNNSNERIPTPQTNASKSSPSLSGTNQQNPLLISASNPNMAQSGNLLMENTQIPSNMPPSSQNGPQATQNPYTRTGFNNQPMRAPTQNSGIAGQNSMPPVSMQGVPPPNHQDMFKQFQTSLPKTTNQNQGNVLPTLSMANQGTGNVPPHSMGSQSLGNLPPPNSSTNQISGSAFQQPTPNQNQFPSSLPNQNAVQGPPLANQGKGFPPIPNQNSQKTTMPPNTGNMAQPPMSAGFQPPQNQGMQKPPMYNPSGNVNSTQGQALGGAMPPMPNIAQGPPSTNQGGGMPPMPPMTNQNAGNVAQSISGPPLPNQTSGFQQYNPNQNSRPPMPNQGIGSFPPQQQTNQNAGYPQFSPIPNKNTGKPPMGNIYPPMPGNQVPTSQYGQFQNKPNQPSQNYSQNQNLVGPPPTSMPPGPNLNQNKNPMAPPPMYNTGLEAQKPAENTSYPSTPTSALHKNRYAPNYEQTATYTTQNRQNAPNQMYQQSYGQNYQSLNQGMSNMNLGQQGFNRIYGSDNVDLLQCPNVLPQERIDPPRVCLGQECLNNANCSPEIFRCTMTKIPETNALLQKSRLPLGVLIHPFKDLNHLPVIQCSSIVRCRACRTYINPFVYFVDTKRWKCNLCYRVNELPEEFQYDPVSKSYGDPSRRPEIKSSTIEYIAPSEYMLRPPQPAVYLFLLDVSRLAIESGYLHTICEVLSSQLQNLPGDSRTQIGFIAYNSTLHFYSLGEGLSQPHEMTVLEIDDVFLPCPDNLLVNLKERMELVTDLLALLPTRFLNSYDNGSALGAAIQAAFKLMSPTGGRITIFQCSLPMIGPGALSAREDPNQRAGKEAPHLNPATDFYKRMALECSGHQVAVDLFVLNSQYVDIATLSGISRFSGGCMHHFPLFKASKSTHAESLEKCFKRYLSRKIGFEAVMRIRCTRGLAIHTFHGNFFVRSTDLLSLPNINPDAGFGMQVSIEESLSDVQNVCFQAALLYTSSKGERRIRVHTLCLPVCNNLPEIINSADQQCIIGVLSKMAVDRSLQSSLSDARDAFINVAIDILHSYKVSLNMGEAGSGLLASHNLKLLPMYILALLKHTAFRTGMSTRLDDRVFAMCEMKTLPLCYLIQQVYPDLYPIHNLTDEGGVYDSEGILIPQPPRLQLTSRNIDGFGAYLMDCGQQMIIFVCQKVSPSFLTHVLGVPNFNSISDQFHELPKIDNPDNQRLHTFIASLNDEKPYCASLHIMRENSPNRIIFLEKLIEDRMESALSYNEFLQHIKTQVK